MEIGISPDGPKFSAEITGAKVMLGVPCYGGQMFLATAIGLLDTQAHFASLGLGLGYATIMNESLVQRARNTCVAHFLASDCTHLMFVDADIGFRGHQVARLLAHNLPLVGGLYRKKVIEREDFVATWLPSDGNQARRNPETGAVQCAAIGTGFMLIRRDVILRVVEAFPNLRYQQHPDDGGPGDWLDHTYALFDCWIDPATRAYLSEDYAFCARWRALGGEVWCDPAIILEHNGTARFTGDPCGQIKVPA